MEVTQCQGEGHGSCRRCTNKTGWNMSWMCFLYKIKGLNGCYCGECVKEIREMAHNGICPNCGSSMEMIGVEQGLQCDTCGFKYDALGNPDTSEMEEGDLSEPNSR